MLEQLLFWWALGTLLMWAGALLEHAAGNGRLMYLRDLSSIDPESAPPVSIVVAARNEAAGVEHAVRSMLGQRYPALEVVVVDDRSEDRTGEILAGLQAELPMLRVVTLRDLPAGWLGKNHALQRGAAAAGGEWLLFTDADIVMHPETVGRAIGYAVDRPLDHLAAAPALTMRSWMLQMFGAVFALMFSQYAKPWKARDPRSRRHIGIGAFNLVRAAAYREIGGHEPIRLRPDDDMKLGKRLKDEGFRQDMVFGSGMISVEWYTSVGEAVRGLEKNAFAGVDYSVAKVAGSAIALFFFAVWPFIAPFALSGSPALLFAAAALILMVLYAGAARAAGAPQLLAPLMPLGVMLFIYVVVRSTVLALARGGIHWRGTFYPLDQLRANRV